MTLSILLFLFGLTLIYFSSEWLIFSSEKLGKIYKLPEVLIGFILLGLGTSAPEIAISWYSAFIGNSDILFGNIVGSNIMNILLVFGFALAIKPIKFHRPRAQTTITLLVLTILFSIGIYFNNFFRILGGLMLVLGCFNIFSSLKNDGNLYRRVDKTKGKIKYILYVIGSLFLLILSSKIIVNSGVEIAEYFGINEGIFAMSFVAFGTSLPEFMLSILAVYKNRGGLLVGNIIGSNICNIAFALGISILIKPFSLVSNDSLIIIGALLFSTALFLLACYFRALEKRIFGIFMLLCFIIIYSELFITAS
tara:strand:- start:4925 stop:5848 length:924 start_codon:yes stop_codon:yes gene_type:complete